MWNILFLYSCLSLAGTSSILTENYPMKLHSPVEKGKSSYSSAPFEDFDNALSGGRDVDPLLPPPVLPMLSNASTVKPSSVKKELHDMFSTSEENTGHQPPDRGTEGNVRKYYEDRVLHGQVVSNSVVESNIEDGGSESRVVARKGVVFNSTEDGINVEVGSTVYNRLAEETTTTSSTLNISTSSAAFSGEDIPSNDIPQPPLKIGTTESYKVTLFSVTSPTLNSTNKMMSTTTILKSVAKPLLAVEHVKHSKPMVAVDAAANKPFNSTSVIMGVSFGVVVIIAVAILAYKKLQDVWSRRHYDRMDFLIDGMYDL